MINWLTENAMQWNYNGFSMNKYVHLMTFVWMFQMFRVKNTDFKSMPRIKVIGFAVIYLYILEICLFPLCTYNRMNKFSTHEVKKKAKVLSLTSSLFVFHFIFSFVFFFFRFSLLCISALTVFKCWCCLFHIQLNVTTF